MNESDMQALYEAQRLALQYVQTGQGSEALAAATRELTDIPECLERSMASSLQLGLMCLRSLVDAHTLIECSADERRIGDHLRAAHDWAHVLWRREVNSGKLQ